MAKSFAQVLLLALVAGCSFHARSPDEYRDATQALLDTKSAEIKACYDTLLKDKADVSGKVTVHFKVAKETGQIMEVSADPAATQAPAELTDCVVKSLNGLALNPPDARDGVATFEYDFSVAPPKPAS